MARQRVYIRPGFIEPVRCPKPELHEGIAGKNNPSLKAHLVFAHGFVFEDVPVPPRVTPASHCDTCICFGEAP